MLCGSVASAAGIATRLPARSPSSLRYVSNKAGLTGQTVLGRRIPGHWPYLGPDELAETEPVCPDRETFLSFTPHGHAGEGLRCRRWGLHSWRARVADHAVDHARLPKGVRPNMRILRPKGLKDTDSKHSDIDEGKK